MLEDNKPSLVVAEEAIALFQKLVAAGVSLRTLFSAFGIWQIRTLVDAVPDNQKSMVVGMIAFSIAIIVGVWTWGETKRPATLPKTRNENANK